MNAVVEALRIVVFDDHGRSSSAGTFKGSLAVVFTIGAGEYRNDYTRFGNIAGISQGCRSAMNIVADGIFLGRFGVGENRL